MSRRKHERSSHGSTYGRNITKRSSCLKAELVAAIFDSHVRSRQVLGAVSWPKLPPSWAARRPCG